MTTPALARDVKGKGRMYPHPIGDLVLSVTNILGCFDKSMPLMWWASERVLSAVATDPGGFINDVIEHGRDEAVRLWKGKWRKDRDDAADRGTEIHVYLERRVGLGWDDEEAGADLSPDALPYLPAARQFLTDHADTIRGTTEVTLFGPGYAGTADLVGTLTGNDLGPIVVDYKTRKKHAVYEAERLQLAALRWATHRGWLGEDGPEYCEAPPRLGAAVVTFTPTSYRVHDLTDKTGKDTFSAFLALRDVRTWMVTK